MTITAACKGEDTAMFFPVAGQRNKPAKAICARCDLLQLCREYAINHREIVGVWGGTTAHERATIRRVRGMTHPRRPIQPDTPNGSAAYNRDKRIIEDATRRQGLVT